MRIVFIFLLLSGAYLSAITHAQNPAYADHESAIRYLINQFLETRAANDETALRALLTRDIDQLTTSGNLRSGREDVVNGSLASSRNNTGTRSITVTDIRFITPEVAIANGSYDIIDRTDGPDSHYLTSYILVLENSSWKISAIRNMEPNIKKPAKQALVYGAPGRSRTSNRSVRSRVLYPVELRVRVLKKSFLLSLSSSRVLPLDTPLSYGR